MSLLEVNKLSFSYENNDVFSDVSFSVEEGQVFCLVGPNGCGKTTLLHCILSHLKPYAGSIQVAGKSLESYSPRDLAAFMAYVPQSHTRFFPYQTVDVVAMGRSRLQRLLEDSSEQRRIAQEYMDKLGIGHLANTDYTTLSGGELQMVLVARALAQESTMLVLDEPVAHLDVKRSQAILQLLAKLAKDQGKTILLSTHDFNHPLYFQDEGTNVRMALMEGGVLGDSDVPLDLLSSGFISEVYGIESTIVEVEADRTRHYLAAWSKS